MDIEDARDVIAKRLTAQIIGPSDDHNGGRLSGSTASGLAHLSIGALLEQGYAVVKLPESTDGNYWYRAREYFFVDDSDFEFLIMTKHGTTFGDPDEAYETAVAMLAAANEGGQLRDAHNAT